MPDPHLRVVALLPTTIATDKRIRGAAESVLIRLHEEGIGRRFAAVPVAKVAADCDLARSTVYRALARLTQLGYLARRKGPRGWEYRAKLWRPRAS